MFLLVLFILEKLKIPLAGAIENSFGSAITSFYTIMACP